MDLTDEQLELVVGGAPEDVFNLLKTRLINEHLSSGIKNDNVNNSILNDRDNHRVDIQCNTDDNFKAQPRPISKG